MKMQKWVLAGAAVALPLLAVQGATAEDADKPGTVLELNAQARRVVKQDRVSVTMGVQKDGKTAEEVQKAINAQMAAAKKIYDKADGVKVSTGSYNVWQNVEVIPMADGKGSERKVTSWHGNQQVTLDAAAGDDILKLVGQLQGAGLATQGMNYYLSRSATDALSDDLMVEALGTITARAAKLGKALGMPNMSFETVSTGDAGGGYQPVPMMAKAMMARDAAESMPAPVGQAGETEVNVMVNAKVRVTK